MKLNVSIIPLIIIAAAALLGGTLIHMVPKIFFAIDANDPQWATAIIKENPAIVFIHTPDGWSPLHIAVEKGRTQIAEVLLQHGADVHDGGTKGFKLTPLFSAKDAQTATLLITYGANVHAQDKHGDTPLHSANATVARVLIKHGANVNVANKSGETPLHHANRDLEKVKLLVEEYGADAMTKDNSGQTPLDCAKKWDTYYDSPEFQRIAAAWIQEIRKQEKPQRKAVIEYLERMSA